MFLTKRTKLLLSNCLCILVAVGFTNAAILTPPYFNLVANKRVAATATCGEGVREPELYCKLTGSSATDREASSYANLIQVSLFTLLIINSFYNRGNLTESNMTN